MFYASPDGGLKYWRRDWQKIDPVLLESAVEMVAPGDVVWDIGANVGLFTFAAAGLAGAMGRVYAFEPDTFLLQLLRRSARIHNPNSAAVDVVPCAVADSLSLQRFNIAGRARAANHLEGLGSSEIGGVRETQTVLCVTLDWLLTQLPAPTVLKIDAEGAEARILAGGMQLLQEHRPKIICEVNAENQRAVTEVLAALAYSLFNAEQPRSQRTPTTTAPWATLAFPATVGRADTAV